MNFHDPQEVTMLYTYEREIQCYFQFTTSNVGYAM